MRYSDSETISPAKKAPNGSDKPTLLKNNVTAAGTIKRQMECESCEYVYEISNSSYIN